MQSTQTDDMLAPSPRERTRTFAWEDPTRTVAAMLDRSGLELLRAIRDGEMPPPPIAQMLGMRIVEVENGRAVFALDPEEWMYNPIGSVRGGIAATILDSCMGCAVHSVLPPGVGYTTTDLQIRYVRAMGADTGPVVAEGTVVHAGRRLATAEGRLVARSTGQLIAHASTGCILLPGSGS